MLWIELLCNSYTFGYGTEGTPNYGRDVNGNNPFTSTLGGGFYDLCIAGRRKCTAMPQSKRGHRKQTFIRQPFTYENL